MMETERLRLRNWTMADVEPFVRHTNTPAVMRWLGGVKTPAELEAIVRDRFIRWQETRGRTFWVVERKADDALLGFCGLKVADDAGSPVEGEHEVGWRLREDAWGQGYAREAATASLDFAFDTLAASRVVALTVDGNRPSWGLMERLGMTRRPELDYDGPAWAEGRVIVYSIGRDEWRA
ncbi:N-acetyltransferase [Sphingomonas parva]|uniref:N-acetyltransferase n=1 Tax=Sphingomonas parva TaxID=2555898 RepID=A0A4Y8ZUT9_9SPHN|nr:GNAT family N-acetyltransferase [Sphingomonas parva]TFI59237.1 N-acetyltransferase [Sphingomonas parva]